MTESKYKEEILHHLYHRDPDEPAMQGREVHIQGSTLTIHLASSDPEENMRYLTEKALELYNKIKENTTSL